MASKPENKGTPEKEPEKSQAEMTRDAVIDELIREAREGIVTSARRRSDLELRTDPNEDDIQEQTGTINFLVRVEDWLRDLKT